MSNILKVEFRIYIAIEYAAPGSSNYPGHCNRMTGQSKQFKLIFYTLAEFNGNSRYPMIGHCNTKPDYSTLTVIFIIIYNIYIREYIMIYSLIRGCKC